MIVILSHDSSTCCSVIVKWAFLFRSHVRYCTVTNCTELLTSGNQVNWEMLQMSFLWKCRTPVTWTSVTFISVSQASFTVAFSRISLKHKCTAFTLILFFPWNKHFDSVFSIVLEIYSPWLKCIASVTNSFVCVYNTFCNTTIHNEKAFILNSAEINMLC